MQGLLSITRRSRIAAALFALSGLLLILLLASLAIGAVSITPTEVLHIFGYRLGFFSTIDETKQLVLFNIRMPRLIFTVLIGSALGLSGAVLQGIFRNPLVEPSIIGVSHGAALGTMLMIMLLHNILPQFVVNTQFWLRPLFAFAGGLIATFFTLQLSRFAGRTHVTYLILGGVAITALAQAAIGLAIFYADDNQLRTYTFWTLGDLSGATWERLNIIIPIITISCGVLLMLTRPLNAIALGEAEAFHSGVPVERVKVLGVLFSAMAVGTAVAFSGIIGFVGLVVPHIIRISFISDHRLVLPASAIGGACLLTLSDIFARTVVAPAELPIGVVTAMIGTPFFIYLLLSSRKKRLI